MLRGYCKSFYFIQNASKIVKHWNFAGPIFKLVSRASQDYNLLFESQIGSTYKRLNKGVKRSIMNGAPIFITRPN